MNDAEGPSQLAASEAPEAASSTTDRSRPWWGITAMVVSLLGAISFIGGGLLLDSLEEQSRQANPDEPLISITIDGETLSEKSETEVLDVAKERIGTWWSDRTREGDDVSEGASEASDAEADESRSRVEITVGSKRPAWIRTLDQVLLVLTIGGAAAGIGLGAISQLRGEPLGWGVAAEVIGLGTLGLLVVGMMLAAIIGAILLAVIVAVIMSLLGLSG
ncbi:MAG: hypothetical protein AAF663_11810 [Planctomycetota bacterium]